MTVPTSDNREQYLGNDSATEFDYAFKIFDADDLTVILTASDDTETTLVRSTDYSVDGVGEESGGTLTYPLSGDPLATGETLTILREIDITQETDLRNQGRYYPETLEDEFDRGRMIDQQQQEQLGRALMKTKGGGDFDADGLRIKSLGSAVDPSDAMSKQDVIDYTQGLESGEIADTAIVNTSTGEQPLPAALDARVNKGEVGVEGVSTSTGEQSLEDALDARVSISGPLETENGSDNITTALDKKLSKSHVSIKHFTEHNGQTLRYDVIKVAGALDSIVKKAASTPDVDGSINVETAKTVSQESGLLVAINADYGPSDDVTSIPSGLQIIDGAAVKEWDDDTENSIAAALVQMDDGSIIKATRGDDLSASKTASDWVDEGAVWSVAGPVFLVEGGVKNDVTATSNVPSARTVFGVNSDNERMFLLVEGATDDYGLTADEAASLAADIGFETAILLDGGGSTQCWWNDCYAIPSSDAAETRKRPTFLCIDSNNIPAYDTGYISLEVDSAVAESNAAAYPALYYRQKGAQVSILFNCTLINNIQGDLVTLNPNDGLPARFRNENGAICKGIIYGDVLCRAALGGPNVNVWSEVSSSSQATGSLTYPARRSS